MSRRRVKPADRRGSCEAVEAEFVFGPQRCHRAADSVMEDDGEWFYVCDEHLATETDAHA